MIKSMTGFGSKAREIPAFGKISVELRSSNHKFLETVFHLPEGFLSLEDRIKKEIEARVKRGRITCVINIIGGKTSNVFINRPLLKNYILALKKIQGQFHIQDEASLDTLIHLPGVLSLAESAIPKEKIWPRLERLVNLALDDLVKMRSKEGQALYRYLKNRAGAIKSQLDTVKIRFKKVIKAKSAEINTDEERSSFLKNTDISEEVERLTFHLRNFIYKLSKDGSIGKELDFIAQEMQREANTMGAKSCDAFISTWVVQIKSQVEKIREQLQNIE